LLFLLQVENKLCRKYLLNLRHRIKFKKMQSVESHIEKSIKSKPKGSLVLPSDFMQYGTAKAVQKSLERLEDKGIIIRVAQGIYVRPKISKLIGPLTPSAEEVAEAIARR